MAAQRGAKLDFDAGIAGDRPGQGVGNVAFGVAGGKQDQRHCPNARDSARHEAVDGGGDRRFGEFEKAAGHVPIGSFSGDLLDEESELGQTDRIARAMANDQQSAAGFGHRIIGEGFTRRQFRCHGVSRGRRDRSWQCAWPAGRPRSGWACASRALVVYWTPTPAATRRVPTGRRQSA